MEDIRAMLEKMGREIDIKLTGEQLEKFQRYMEFLLEWNERLNLTAITEPEQVAEKHFIDSLTVLNACSIKPGAKVLDVGTGAGFPDIPMKLVRPDLELTLLDGANKRLKFLEELCRELGISCARVHKRAEEAGRDNGMREAFDIVTARAVAGLSILSEYCIPLLKMKGYFVAMKGPGATEEIDEAKQAIHTLGGGQLEVKSITLPMAGERNLVVVRKLRYTPKEYPRHGGTIAKHPL